MPPVDLTTLSVYLVLGVIAGMISGLLGLGGGIVIVPALLFIFIQQDMPVNSLMQMAIATSLATIVFTSLSSAWAHHKRRAILWPSVKLLVPGIILGGSLGAIIADLTPSDGLRVLFGIFELMVAIQVGIGIKPSPKRELPGTTGMFITGGGIGAFSTLLGIGGGTLTVPFLLWCNVNIRNAVATSAACGLPIALAGSLGMIFTGWNQPGLPIGSTGYVYWPAAIVILAASVVVAPVGAKLAHTLPIIILKRIFALVLAGVGIRMLIG